MNIRLHVKSAPNVLPQRIDWRITCVIAKISPSSTVHIAPKRMPFHEKVKNDFIKIFSTNKYGLQLSFRFEGNLMHHLRTHDEPSRHICEVCAVVFKSKISLISHLRKHTGEPEPDKNKVQCDICSSWFLNRQRLKAHMARHTAQPVKCDKCDKISPNRSALESHMRSVHADADFKCHLCPKVFKYPLSLKVCVDLWIFTPIKSFNFVISLHIHLVEPHINAFEWQTIQVLVLRRIFHLADKYVQTPEKDSLPWMERR